MKKHIYIAFLFCIVSLTGCDNFLTVESPDFSTDKFWRDSVDVESGLSAAYGQLDNRAGSYNFAEIKFVVETFREDIMNIGADVNNYPEWGRMYDFTYNNESSRIKEYWMNCYNGINYTNNVLFGIRKVQSGNNPMSTAKCNSVQGEALFLRAYYHMKLLLNWEKIVIRNEYLTTEVEVHKALSSREDGWDFVCSELSDAAKILPQTRPSLEAGRVTNGTAYAYLGWAYLTRAYEVPDKKAEYLEKAAGALDQVKGYSLEKDFLSMFNGTNKNCKESIFEIQFTGNTSDGAFHQHVLHYWVAAPVLRGWDEIRPSQMILDEFRKEGRVATTGNLDSRAYATMFFNDPYFNDGEGRIYGFEYSDLFDENDEINRCFRKYMPDDMQKLKQSYTSTNVPLMRYANVLLMQAEIHNEQGHPELAAPLINDIRKVHGDMPEISGDSYDFVKAQIEHERLMEFVLENYRFYDLRRWGKLDEALHAAGRVNFHSEKHAFLPIPLMEIQSNNNID